MGGSCGCLFRKEPPPDPVARAPPERGKKKKLEELKCSDSVETQEETPRAHERDVSILQAFIRTYLARKHNLNRPPATRSAPGLDSTSEFLSATEVACMPDELLTPQVKAKIAKVGPYAFQLKIEGGTRKKPMKLSNGNFYFGEWKDGRLFGKGVLYTQEGGLMEGYWDEILHGDGRVILPSGEYYEGGFWYGLKQGYGRFEDESGTVYYEGEWLYDKRHGLGIERTPDSVYEGSFRNDQKSGNGLLKWTDGEVYEGEFEGNMIHGVGKYFWSETKWYQGEWQQNKMHGKGKFLNAGSEYEGDFVMDKKQGKGVYKWEGNLYEGEWHDGKMHGMGYLTMKGKRRGLYYFENNRRIGARIRDRRSEPMRATF